MFLFFWVFSITAQKASTFKEVLKTAKEISITDSFIHLDYASLNKVSLDKTTGISFCKIIERKEIDSLNEADYSIAGKITSHKDFDILLLCIERSFMTGYINGVGSTRVPSGRLLTKELFFVLIDKEGNFKNSFLAGIDYKRKDFDKNITRKMSSWVYNDLRIIQHSVTDHWSSYLIYSPLANNKEYSYSMEYRINDYGVFVAYPKFKSN